MKRFEPGQNEKEEILRKFAPEGLHPHTRTLADIEGVLSTRPTFHRHLIVKTVLTVGLTLCSCVITLGQSIETIYSFGSGGTGVYPNSLTLGNDGTFYGTCRGGNGTVFNIGTNASCNLIVSFAGTNGSAPNDLVKYADGSFYGTTFKGGISNNGTVFRVTTDRQLTTISFFNGTNGANPQSGLTVGSDGNLYGTTKAGGDYGLGTVFKVATNGVLTTLASFAQTNGAISGLVQGADGLFYGTTLKGGNGDSGTVFKVTTNGVLTLLSSTGGYPAGGLVQGADGNLYGTSQAGGDSGYGEVFRVTPNGLLTRVASFEGTNGDHPFASLIVGSDGAMYGTTMTGGNGFLGSAGTGYGTVFRVTTNGNLTMLGSFSVTGTNGFAPASGLSIGPDGFCYGTTQSGGAYGYYGVVFRLRFPISIAILPVGSSGTTGTFGVAVSGLTAQGPAILQTSSNLVDWLSIQTNPPISGSLMFQNLSVTNEPIRFFRVFEQD